MSKQSQCPFAAFGRERSYSSNSVQLSPLQIINSPENREISLLDQALSSVPLFKLENDQQDHHLQPIQEEDSAKYSKPPLTHEQELQLQQPMVLNQKTILAFLLKHLNKHEEFIQKARKQIELIGSQFMRNLLHVLLQRLKTVKKTKEEKIKYCIRKSFKHITTKMKKQNKQKYSEMETYQIMAQFFQLHSHEPIDIPFKKNSELKTMNSMFLRKVFSCSEYIKQYKTFLQELTNELQQDNIKKIKNMNQAINKCYKNNNFNSINQLKRLPWSDEVIESFESFALELLRTYFVEENLKGKRIFLKEQMNSINFEQQGQIQEFLNAPIARNKSLCLTPTIKQKQEPIESMDFGFALQ